MGLHWTVTFRPLPQPLVGLSCLVSAFRVDLPAQLLILHVELPSCLSPAHPSATSSRSAQNLMYDFMRSAFIPTSATLSASQQNSSSSCTASSIICQVGGVGLRYAPMRRVAKILWSCVCLRILPDSIRCLALQVAAQRWRWGMTYSGQHRWPPAACAPRPRAACLCQQTLSTARQLARTTWTCSVESLCCKCPYSMQAKSVWRPSSREMSTLEKLSPGMRPRFLSQKMAQKLQ